MTRSHYIMFSHFMNEIANFCIKKEDGNVVFSPVSIWIGFELLSDMTAGRSHEEIKERLIGDDYINITSNGESDQIHLMNAVFRNEETAPSINQSFLNDVLKNKYRVRFFSSDNYVNAVNNWVAEKTANKITRILDDSHSNDVFGILNVTTFNAKWKREYKDSDIQNKVFHNKNKTVSRIPFLKSSERYYLENAYAEGFLKPYEKEEYSFMGLLPKNEEDDVMTVLSLTDIRELCKQKTNAYDVHVKIPEFKAESQLDIKEFCLYEEVSNIFSNDADFSPFSDEWLKVDEINHKAMIEVDREGTRAAAAIVTSEIYGYGRGYKETKQIILDRPFLFAVVHNRTGIPVFAGVVNYL